MISEEEFMSLKVGDVVQHVHYGLVTVEGEPWKGGNWFVRSDHGHSAMSNVVRIVSRASDSKPEATTVSKYARDFMFYDLAGNQCTAKHDVYDVLIAFDVTCPAVAHAVKKLLMAGERGHKDRKTDLREAIAAIERAIELEAK